MAASEASIRQSARNHGRSVARQATKVAESSQLAEVPIEDIWTEYAKTHSKEIRNYLFHKYLQLVWMSAERICKRLPDEVDIDDLMSEGLFGLIGAIDAYDLSREVKFETYSAPRIRGAILDGLRHMDWVPRLVRYRTARVEQVRSRHQMETGYVPSNDEIVARLNLAPDEIEKYERDSRAVAMTSITRKAFPSDGSRELREIDVIKDDAQLNPLRQLHQRDLKDLITKGLSRAERLIVLLYYYENMTMKEIGATLDLSESRVSQMHSSILQRLKSQMQHRARELEPVE